MQQTDYERRGYLHEDFRLFHLSSALAEDTAFHYHEFHKLVFFLAGRGNYIVEGRTHVLRPYDVVLVRQGAIHKAQIDPSQRYERVILYISPEFLRTQSTADSSLDACFRLPADGQSFVLRPEAGRRAALLLFKSWLPGRTNTGMPASRTRASRRESASWLSRAPLKVRSPERISASGFSAIT